MTTRLELYDESMRRMYNAALKNNGEWPKIEAHEVDMILAAAVTDEQIYDLVRIREWLNDNYNYDEGGFLCRLLGPTVDLGWSREAYLKFTNKVRYESGVTPTPDDFPSPDANVPLTNNTLTFTIALGEGRIRTLAFYEHSVYGCMGTNHELTSDILIDSGQTVFARQDSRPFTLTPDSNKLDCFRR